MPCCTLAGRLDLALGGPSVDPAKEESSLRRAIYFTQSADTEHRFLAAFDNSNVLECYRRQESIVPQQALALANSKLTRECADAIVKRAAVAPRCGIHRARFPFAAQPRADSGRAHGLPRKPRGIHQAQRRPRPHARLQALMNHNDFVTLR